MLYERGKYRVINFASVPEEIIEIDFWRTHEQINIILLLFAFEEGHTNLRKVQYNLHVIWVFILIKSKL